MVYRDGVFPKIQVDGRHACERRDDRALVATIAFGSRTLTYELTQLQLVAVALRNHTNADMMQDAIRADVYAAFYFSDRDPALKAEVTADLRENADTMLGLIKINNQLALPASVKVTLDALSDARRG